MKKLSVLLLASAFAFAVAGCNSSGTDDDGDGADQGASLDGKEPAEETDSDTKPTVSRSAFVDAIDIGAGGLMSKTDTATVAGLADSLNGATAGYLANAIGGALEAASAGGEVHADNLLAVLNNLTLALNESADENGANSDLAATLATITAGLAGGLKGDNQAVSSALLALESALDDLLAAAGLNGVDREVLLQLRGSL